MKVLLIVVFIGVSLGLWPVFVRHGVRRGVERTYLYERISFMPAGLIAAFVVTPFVVPVSGVIGAGLAAVLAVGFWVYVTTRSIPGFDPHRPHRTSGGTR